MIGIMDDTRFLTENRHDQLLAEAEVRRLTAGTSPTSILRTLRDRLFGPAAATVVTTAPQAVSSFAPVAILADRTRSVSECGEEHAAAA